MYKYIDVCIYVYIYMHGLRDHLHDCSRYSCYSWCCSDVNHE